MKGFKGGGILDVVRIKFEAARLLIVGISMRGTESQ